MGYKAAERVRDRVEGVVLDLRAFELVDTDRLIGAAWLSDLLLDRVGHATPSLVGLELDVVGALIAMSGWAV